MSSVVDPSIEPAIARLTAEILVPLFEADGSVVHGVRRKDGVYVVTVGGAIVGSPAVDLVRRTVLEPAFSKALGEAIHVEIETRVLVP